MDVLSVGTGAYVIYISRQEYTKISGCGGEDVNRENTARLIGQILGCKRVAPQMDVKLFEGQDEMMMFAWLKPTFCNYYYFVNFEDVISACDCCGEIADSELYYYDEAYILAVPEITEEKENVLSEFGIKLDCGVHFNLFMSEHGKVIISADAVNFVKNAFKK